MRPAIALLTTLAAFGCTNQAPSINAAGIESRTPRSMRVMEDVDAMQQGMDRAAQSVRAGL